jgi:hypothetical protein
VSLVNPLSRNVPQCALHIFLLVYHQTILLINGEALQHNGLIKVLSSGFKIKISNFEIFVGVFAYVNFLPAVFIFDNESVNVRR